MSVLFFWSGSNEDEKLVGNGMGTKVGEFGQETSTIKSPRVLKHFCNITLQMKNAPSYCRNISETFKNMTQGLTSGQS